MLRYKLWEEKLYQQIYFESIPLMIEFELSEPRVFMILTSLSVWLVKSSNVSVPDKKNDIKSKLSNILIYFVWRKRFYFIKRIEMSN